MNELKLERKHQAPHDEVDALADNLGRRCAVVPADHKAVITDIHLHWDGTAKNCPWRAIKGKAQVLNTNKPQPAPGRKIGRTIEAPLYFVYNDYLKSDLVVIDDVVINFEGARADAGTGTYKLFVSISADALRWLKYRIRGSFPMTKVLSTADFIPAGKICSVCVEVPDRAVLALADDDGVVHPVDVHELVGDGVSAGMGKAAVRFSIAKMVFQYHGVPDNQLNTDFSTGLWRLGMELDTATISMFVPAVTEEEKEQKEKEQKNMIAIQAIGDKSVSAFIKRRLGRI